MRTVSHRFAVSRISSSTSASFDAVALSLASMRFVEEVVGYPPLVVLSFKPHACCELVAPLFVCCVNATLASTVEQYALFPTVETSGQGPWVGAKMLKYLPHVQNGV